MFGRRSFAAIVLAGVALPAGLALAQGQPIVGIETTRNFSVDGRITAVDPSARTVTLTLANGDARVLNVSSVAANFANTRVGDTVSLDVEETHSFVLSGPNTATPVPGKDAVAAAVTVDGATAGAVAANSVRNWLVTAANPAAGTISLVNPAGGEVRTFQVKNPIGREQLSRVKPGDRLTNIKDVTAVIAITPKK